MRLIFHIGMPKCGTSTVQNVLSSYPEILMENGILYPNFDRFRETYMNLRHHSTGNGNPFVYILNGQKDPEVAPNLRAKKVFEDFRDQIKSANPEMIVISHEDMIGFPISFMIEIAESIGLGVDDIEVVMHIRRHESWIASDYQQHIKQLRSCASLEEHVGNRLHVVQFGTIARRFSQRLGHKKVHIRLLDRDIKTKNIVHDMFAMLGYPIDSLATVEIYNGNEGVLGSYIPILRSANKKKVSDKKFSKILNLGLKGRARAAKGKSNSFVLPYTLALIVWHFSAKDRTDLKPFLTDEEIDILEAPPVFSYDRENEFDEILEHFLIALEA